MTDPVPVQYTCPVCGQTVAPAAQYLHVAVCGRCGAGLHVNADGSVLRATAEDTGELPDVVLQELRHARGQLARPRRRG